MFCRPVTTLSTFQISLRLFQLESIPIREAPPKEIEKVGFSLHICQTWAPAALPLAFFTQFSSFFCLFWTISVAKALHLKFPQSSCPRKFSSYVLWAWHWEAGELYEHDKVVGEEGPTAQAKAKQGDHQRRSSLAFFRSHSLRIEVVRLLGNLPQNNAEKSKNGFYLRCWHHTDGSNIAVWDAAKQNIIPRPR